MQTYTTQNNKVGNLNIFKENKHMFKEYIINTDQSIGIKQYCILDAYEIEL